MSHQATSLVPAHLDQMPRWTCAIKSNQHNQKMTITHHQPNYPLVSFCVRVRVLADLAERRSQLYFSWKNAPMLRLSQLMSTTPCSISSAKPYSSCCNSNTSKAHATKTDRKSTRLKSSH